MFARATAALTTLFASSRWLLDAPLDGLLHVPVVSVNDDDGLLSVWPSEAYGADPDAVPECEFFNSSVVYSASLCSMFTIARAASAPQIALERALRCSGAFGAECILSPEVGLGLPAAFLYDHAAGKVDMLIAPRLLPLLEAEREDNHVQHVRVAPPDGDGNPFATATYTFNKTIYTEYLDGATRTMATRALRGEAAWCVQLLRDAFEPACWAKLD